MVSRSDLDEIQAQLKISIQNHQVSEPCQLFGGTSEKLSKKNYNVDCYKFYKVVIL